MRFFLTFLFRLFGIPRTADEFVQKAREARKGIIISYQTREEVVTPIPRASPFMPYEILLVLRMQEMGTLKNKKELDVKNIIEGKAKSFKVLLESGTKTQFSDNDPVLHEALESVQLKLPEIIQLCNKYQVQYQLDDRIADLLVSHSLI